MLQDCHKIVRSTKEKQISVFVFEQPRETCGKEWRNGGSEEWRNRGMEEIFIQQQGVTVPHNVSSDRAEHVTMLKHCNKITNNYKLKYNL